MADQYGQLGRRLIVFLTSAMTAKSRSRVPLRLDWQPFLPWKPRKLPRRPLLWESSSGYLFVGHLDRRVLVLLLSFFNYRLNDNLII